MRQVRRLRAEFNSEEEAAEFLNMQLRPQDLSGLLELQLFGRDGDICCAMALEGMLRQVCRHASPQHMLCIEGITCWMPGMYDASLD